MTRRPAMFKKYRVTLTAEERDEFEGLLARGKADVRRLKHAQILLKAERPKADWAGRISALPRRWELASLPSSACADDLSRRASPQR